MVKIIKQISKNWSDWAGKEVIIPYYFDFNSFDSKCIITNNNTILFVVALITLIISIIK